MWMQNILVTLIVAACTLYAAWLLTPARPRLRFTQWLLDSAPQPAGKPGLVRKLALLLNRRAAQRLERACGKCQPNK